MAPLQDNFLIGTVLLVSVPGSATGPAADGRACMASFIFSDPRIARLLGALGPARLCLDS